RDRTAEPYGGSMRGSKAAVLHLALMLVVVLRAGDVHAQTPPAEATAPEGHEAAKRHFMLGVGFFNQGNFRAALAEFEHSHQLKPNPAVFYNIGLAQRELHLYQDAIRSFERYLAHTANMAPDRRAAVRRLMQEMSQSLGEIRIAAAPPGTRVRIDG